MAGALCRGYGKTIHLCGEVMAREMQELPRDKCGVVCQDVREDKVVRRGTDGQYLMPCKP